MSAKGFRDIKETMVNTLMLFAIGKRTFDETIVGMEIVCELYHKEKLGVGKKQQNTESKCNKQNVRFSSSEVRNIVLELKNAALYAHSHKLTRFELQKSLNEVIKKWNVNAR